MASIKDTFAKGITTLNVKTNNFMEENKCKTYISTLEEEIRKLKMSIGEIAYENWENMDSVKEEIQNTVNEINAKYQEIKAQEEKIKSLAEIEQQILGNSAVNEKTAAAGPQEGVVYCSQCGTQNSSSYKFCLKCGKSLE